MYIEFNFVKHSFDFLNQFSDQCKSVIYRCGKWYVFRMILLAENNYS